MPAISPPLPTPLHRQEAQDKSAAGSEGHRTKYVTTFKLRLQTTTEQKQGTEPEQRGQQGREEGTGGETETMAAATTKAGAAFC